jgi:hypothetical protein
MARIPGVDACKLNPKITFNMNGKVEYANDIKKKEVV